MAFFNLNELDMPIAALAPLLIKAAPKIISALPAVAGFVGNLLGKKRRRLEEDKASMGMSNLSDIFKGQLNQDYFDSAEGRGTMTQIDENAQENMNQINATANMQGLTDEARIAMMGQNMKAKQGAFAGLAGQSSLWRQRAQQLYGGSLGQLFSAGMANRQNQQASINNIVGGMQGAIDGATNAGVFDKMLGGITAGGLRAKPNFIKPSNTFPWIQSKKL